MIWLWLACEGPVEPPPEPIVEPPPVVEPPPPLPEWTLQASGGDVQFVSPEGAVLAELSPEVIVRTQSRTAESAEATAWTLDGDALVASMTTKSTRWDVRIEGGARVQWTATATVTAPVQVELLYAELSFAAPAATALDRAYREVSLADGPVYADAWTPQVLRVGELAFVGRSLAQRAELDDGQLRVRVYGDSLKEHPLQTWSACSDEATIEPPKADRSAVTWPVGSTFTMGFTLSPSVTAVPVPLRFPHGRKAALVFTDHADQSDAAKLGALMYGRSTAADPLVAKAEGKGFAGRGLAMTKTVFPLSAPGHGYSKQLDSEPYRAVLDALHAAGTEIGPHSASGAADAPERTREGLTALAPYAPATWVDHQPNTNCEAVTNQGFEDGPWSSVPAIAAAGLRYVWSGTDDVPGKEINLFDPEARDAARPVLHRHPLLGDALWVFHTRWRAVDRGVFLGHYDTAHLDQLVEQRGLHIAHTYLDTWREDGVFAGWSLLRREPDGYSLRPEADALFAELQSRQATGDLWVASLRDVADHLVAVRGLSWWLDGDAMVVRSPVAVPSLSVLGPNGPVAVDVPANTDVRVTFGTTLAGRVVVRAK